MVLFVLLFHFSIVLSRLREDVTALVQEVGLLKAKAEGEKDLKEPVPRVRDGNPGEG